MPYCGSTYGLTDMTVIAESMFQPDSEKVEITRHKGKAIKRSAPGDEPNPAAPDRVGVGLFKAGTPHRDGIFQCPTDTKFDIKIGEGHNQSSTLDKISESIRKLKQVQQALIADNKADAQWTAVEGGNSPNAASSASAAAPTLGTVLQATQNQEATTPAQNPPKDSAPQDPLDSGRVKRAAIAVAGATGPQQTGPNQS